MAEQDQHSRDDAAAVTQRNIEQSRELLARKHQQEQARSAEPPLADDPNVPSQENPSAQETTGDLGSTGGIRNMGGGCP